MNSSVPFPSSGTAWNRGGASSSGAAPALFHPGSARSRNGRANPEFKSGNRQRNDIGQGLARRFAAWLHTRAGEISPAVRNPAHQLFGNAIADVPPTHATTSRLPTLTTYRAWRPENWKTYPEKEAGSWRNRLGSGCVNSPVASGPQKIIRPAFSTSPGRSVGAPAECALSTTARPLRSGRRSNLKLTTWWGPTVANLAIYRRALLALSNSWPMEKRILIARDWMNTARLILADAERMAGQSKEDA